ncbi:MAG: AMP-binding protein [Alcaligenaceae bacterium]|nr:AMP-binding protein [Alcaligenaceae bacterium]
MSNLRFSSLINERLAAAPDAPLMISASNTVSVRQFSELIDNATGWLRNQGVNRGDRVALWLVNRVEWLVLLAAAARVGAIIVSVNTRYRSEELIHILSASGAQLLITQDRYRRLDFLDTLAQIDAAVVPDLRKIALISDDAESDAPALSWPIVPFRLETAMAERDPDTSLEDDALIMFSTSGTTKAPKLVMQSQRSLVYHARCCAASYGLDQQEAAFLCMPPLCGVFGLNGVLAALVGGAPIVLPMTFDAHEAVDLLRQHRITHTFGSDEMYRRIAELAPDECPFPNARMFGFGAFTSSFTDYALQCIQRGMPLVGLYGSSEVLALFSAQSFSLPVEQRLQGGGLPAAGSEALIRIRDTVSGGLLPPECTGEIEILAPSNFIGYFRDAQATTNAHKDGYFRTGDLGYLREDGSLVFETRMGDAMRLGGHLVNPVEIEDVLKQLPGIHEAHVVASDINGQPRPVAFVVPQSNQQPPDIREVSKILAPLIASFKIPARIWVVDDIPKTEGTNGGKVSRAQLRKMAQEWLKFEKE